jgi:gluconolactonase
MNRRKLLSALPLLGLAGIARGQQATAPSAPAPPPPRPNFNFPPPTLKSILVAEGLKFPEAPVVMHDGSVLFVQIESKQISRLTPDGKVELVKQLEGGPNGLAIGPDRALYIANDGGRFSFAQSNGFNFPGRIPAGFVGGSIQRLDLKTGVLTTLYEECDGKHLIAPDDLVFDHHGGMWISEFGKAPGDAGVYYAQPDGKRIVRVKDGMSGTNGIGLSPDGKQLHVSEGRTLWTWDVISPGVVGPSKAYPSGDQGHLPNRSIVDSLKVLADGKVCVCTLIVGGISIFDAAGHAQLIQFDDPMTTNLAFGGRDMRDTWVTNSGLGKMVKVRWPYPGLKPAYRA